MIHQVLCGKLNVLFRTFQYKFLLVSTSIKKKWPAFLSVCLNNSHDAAIGSVPPYHNRKGDSFNLVNFISDRKAGQNRQPTSRNRKNIISLRICCCVDLFSLCKHDDSEYDHQQDNCEHRVYYSKQVPPLPLASFISLKPIIA